MKRKFSKILGVGLTLALLASLLMTAAPVSALSVPKVELSDSTISKPVAYTITSTIDEDLDDTDEIIVEFDAGIDISTITGVTVAATAGFGTNLFTAVTVQSSDIDVTEQVLTITLTDIPNTIGRIARVTVVVSGITNPDTIGTYILTIATTPEPTAVPSAAFTIKDPVIDVLPGVVDLYNSPGGTHMENYDGDTAIQEAINDAYAGYVINVGEGTYDCDLTIPAGKDNLELVGAEGAIIKGVNIGSAATTYPTIDIRADGVKIHGFTIQGPDYVASSFSDGICIAAKDVEIYANAFEVTGAETNAELTQAIQTWDKGVSGFASVDVSGLNIHHNTFTDLDTSAKGFDGIYINRDIGVDSITIAVNEFTGDVHRAITVERSKATISGNIIITDLEPVATWSGININIFFLEPQDAVTVTGNTIKGSGTDEGFREAIRIGKVGQTLTSISVTNNTVEGNDVGIKVRSSADAVSVSFNTIIDNVTLGVENTDTVNTLDATFNWWGPDGPSVSDNVTTDPVLDGTPETVISDGKVGSGTSLDAKDDVGVSVSVTPAAGVITVAKYTANPEADIAGAIAFYDVYVGNPDAPTDDVTIKFYAGDALTKIYLWSAGTDMWVPLAAPEYVVGFSVYGGYVYVTVDAAMLAGTPFALVSGAAEALTAPKTISPDVGEKDVDLRPSFAWTAIAGVLGYEFELADNPNFVAPLMKLSGELGRLIVPYYQYMPQLDYSKAYYWRVRAVDATAASGWSGGVFITIAEPEPEPEEEPVWMCSEGLTFDSRAALEAHLATAEVHQPVEEPDIILEPPDIILQAPDVILPAETPITPGWIYVIIGVGAVLVISMIVLIVRTRRVA